MFNKRKDLTEKEKARVEVVLKQINPKDIKWILKTIFESHNVWGSDIEQAVITINKLKTKLKEMEDDAIISQVK